MWIMYRVGFPVHTLGQLAHCFGIVWRGMSAHSTGLSIRSDAVVVLVQSVNLGLCQGVKMGIVAGVYWVLLLRRGMISSREWCRRWPRSLLTYKRYVKAPAHTLMKDARAAYLNCDGRLKTIVRIYCKVDSVTNYCRTCEVNRNCTLSISATFCKEY